MGTLRLLLAISVVAFHAGSIFGFRGMGAEAVPAFFVISGFYMALILETTYRGSASAFYLNRLLRLFPMYWAFLFIILALTYLPNAGTDVANNLQFSAQSQLQGMAYSWVSIIPNLFIVGSEWLRQLTVDPTDGSWHWWLYGVPEGPRLKGAQNFLAVPQIWSVGVELTFYAAAPLLVLLRTRTLIVLCVFALVVGPLPTQHLAYQHMLPNVNLWYFLLGMIAYRALPTLAAARREVNLALAAVPFVVAVAWPLLIFDANSRMSMNIAALAVVFACGITSLFVLTKDWAIDRRIGDLSYPVYITHFFFVWPLADFGVYQGILCLAVSLVVSAILLIVVQEPIDRVRRSLTLRARPSLAQ